MITNFTFETQVWWLRRDGTPSCGTLPADSVLTADSNDLQIFTNKDTWLAAITALGLTDET